MESYDDLLDILYNLGEEIKNPLDKDVYLKQLDIEAKILEQNDKVTKQDIDMITKSALTKEHGLSAKTIGDLPVSRTYINGYRRHCSLYLPSTVMLGKIRQYGSLRSYDIRAEFRAIESENRKYAKQENEKRRKVSRETELISKLREKGVAFSKDSSMCQRYIENSEGNINDIVETMCKLKLLREYRPDILSKVKRNCWGPYHISAERYIKFPEVYPWMISSEIEFED